MASWAASISSLVIASSVTLNVTLPNLSTLLSLTYARIFAMNLRTSQQYFSMMTSGSLLMRLSPNGC